MRSGLVNLAKPGTIDFDLHVYYVIKIKLSIKRMLSYAGTRLVTDTHTHTKQTDYCNPLAHVCPAITMVCNDERMTVRWHNNIMHFLPQYFVSMHGACSWSCLLQVHHINTCTVGRRKCEAMIERSMKVHFHLHSATAISQFSLCYGAKYFALWRQGFI